MPRFNKIAFEDMKEARGLDFLERNMLVEVDGKGGKVVGNHGHNLLVKFDGFKQSSNCHPHWKTKYYNKQGEMIKEYKD